MRRCDLNFTTICAYYYHTVT